MFKLVALCFLLNEALSLPINGNCNYLPNQAITSPVTTSGNAVISSTTLPTPNCGSISTSQITPFVTEIVPSLQFGDITMGGDIPIGGSIKVSGYIPVYGAVTVDGAVPSVGTAVINSNTGLVGNCC